MASLPIDIIREICIATLHTDMAARLTAIAARLATNPSHPAATSWPAIETALAQLMFLHSTSAGPTSPPYMDLVRTLRRSIATKRGTRVSPAQAERVLQMVAALHHSKCATPAYPSTPTDVVVYAMCVFRQPLERVKHTACRHLCGSETTAKAIVGPANNILESLRGVQGKALGTYACVQLGLIDQERADNILVADAVLDSLTLIRHHFGRPSSTVATEAHKAQAARHRVTLADPRADKVINTALKSCVAAHVRYTKKYSRKATTS